MKYRVMSPIEEGTSASAGGVEAEHAQKETPTESSPTGDTGGDQSPAAEGEQGEADAASAQTPAFTPSYKVKVMDQELDIPEGFRGLIKDEKSQKEIQEIFEKAYGLDHHKKKTYEPLMQKHTQLTEQVKALDSGMTRLHEMVQDPKSFKEFVDFWKIDKKVLYQFVADELRFEELPEDQQREITSQKERERQAGQHATEAQDFKQRWLRSEAEKQLIHLDTAISREDIADVASKFDARAGKPGAFKQEVIYRGILHEQATGKALSVEEAVGQVMSVLGYEEESAQAGQPATQKVVASVPQKKLPVIPAVGGGGGASPVKRAVNSTDDLRKIYNDKYGSKQIN